MVILLSCHNRRKRHYAKDCRKIGQSGFGTDKVLKKKSEERSRTRTMAYSNIVEEAKKDPNFVLSVFLINNVYTLVLFYSSANRSFVASTFVPLLKFDVNKLDEAYEVDTAIERRK
ncbi:hypothetical protein HanIR_Chr16g0819641 [Helianthus annuus]|nr:hypothetical protein HanIR_Chr16g0819641 [Helianthus annuus]